MVDVVKHSLFPTIINSFEFDMDEQEYNLVINKLNNIEKSREELIIQTPDNLFIDIPKFANSIGTITEKVCEDLNLKLKGLFRIYLTNTIDDNRLEFSKLMKSLNEIVFNYQKWDGNIPIHIYNSRLRGETDNHNFS